MVVTSENQNFLVKVPRERVAVIIGKEGETKKQLEEM